MGWSTASDKVSLLNVNIIVIWGQIIFCCDDCPEHFKMITSIPGVYQYASSITSNL